MKNLRNSRRLGLCSGLLLLAFALDAQADPASKWRVEFDHSVKDAGELVLRVTPAGGTPTDVITKFPDNIGENQAADILKTSLRASLGDGYKVEVDDGEDVLIKRRGKTPKFELTLVSNSVNGLSVAIKRE